MGRNYTQRSSETAWHLADARKQSEAGLLYPTCPDQAPEATLSQQRTVGGAVTLLAAGQMAAVLWQQQSPCVLPTGASDYGVHLQTLKKQQNISSADTPLST